MFVCSEGELRKQRGVILFKYLFFWLPRLLCFRMIYSDITKVSLHFRMIFRQPPNSRNCLFCTINYAHTFWLETYTRFFKTHNVGYRLRIDFQPVRIDPTTFFTLVLGETYLAKWANHIIDSHNRVATVIQGLFQHFFFQFFKDFSVRLEENF